MMKFVRMKALRMFPLATYWQLDPRTSEFLSLVIQTRYTISQQSPVLFIMQDLYCKLKGPAFEVQVGLHELLGHGSGKLFMEVCIHLSWEFRFFTHACTCVHTRLKHLRWQLVEALQLHCLCLQTHVIVYME